jgi:O-antigen/teichoic acid export membrane protein
MLEKFKNMLKNSNNLHSLIGNVVYAGFSMVLFLVLARYTDKELYGRWIIFMTALGLLDMFRVGLAGTGAIRFISISQGLERDHSVGTSYHLNIIITLAISVLFLPAYFLIEPHVDDSYYLPVLLFYPLCSFASLPHMQATNYSQGLMNFRNVMIIRGAVGFFNLLFIGLYIFLAEETLVGLILMYSLSDVVVSLLTILLRWDGWQYLKHLKTKNLKQLLRFGKYSTATSIGSSLLRSSDTFIISLSVVMGAPAVAIYAIPMKFVEMIEIPLRSFAATAFPKLSASFNASSNRFIKDFNAYLSYSVLFLIPVIVVLPFISEWILLFFGGDQYIDALDTQKNILLIIAFYILLLPFDRFIGVGLMAIDKPELNFYKLLIMLVCNIGFNLVAVFVFQSLEMVALATILFTSTGILTGWQMLSRHTELRASIMWTFLKTNFQELKTKYIPRLFKHH